ncbi:MAG: hypothetical protein NTAFB01_15850 [Nitrospira sp.]
MATFPVTTSIAITSNTQTPLVIIGTPLLALATMTDPRIFMTPHVRRGLENRHPSLTIGYLK